MSVGAGLADLLQQLAESEAAASAIDTSDLAAALMRRFGGPDGLADKIFEITEDEDVSPQVKSRVMADVLRLVVEKSKQGSSKGVGALSDEELMEEVSPILQALPQGGPGVDPPAAD